MKGEKSHFESKATIDLVSIRKPRGYQIDMRFSAGKRRDFSPSTSTGSLPALRSMPVTERRRALPEVDRAVAGVVVAPGHVRDFRPQRRLPAAVLRGRPQQLLRDRRVRSDVQTRERTRRTRISMQDDHLVTFRHAWHASLVRHQVASLPDPVHYQPKRNRRSSSGIHGVAGGFVA